MHKLLVTWQWKCVSGCMNTSMLGLICYLNTKHIRDWVFHYPSSCLFSCSDWLSVESPAISFCGMYICTYSTSSNIFTCGWKIQTDFWIYNHSCLELPMDSQRQLSKYLRCRLWKMTRHGSLSVSAFLLLLLKLWIKREKKAICIKL